MIDINKLRRLAQEATPGPWYIGSGTYEGRNIYSVEAVTDDEGFTYNPVVATAEDDEVACWDANARLIAAANPAAISELLGRLEAAESDAAHQKALADSALRVANGWERKCVELRARIDAMVRQEPVAWARKLGLDVPSFGCVTDLKYRPSNIPESSYIPLYTLPGAQSVPKAVAYLDLGTGGYMDIGTDLTDEALAALPKGRHMLGIVGTYGVDGYVPAQPAPSINEGVRKVTLGFRWESEAQHHIPTIEIEFDPVSPDSPNDAKGWQDRDRIASMLSPEAKP